MSTATDPPIRRNLAAVLRREAKHYPVLTVTGPRQSGKTTLCRDVFRGKPYVSFETLDSRERAQRDPRGLLGDLPRGAVLDEIQHVPELLSYDLVHFRQTQGCEVDIGVVRGRSVTLLEAKSGATVNEDFFAGLRVIRADLQAGRDFDEVAAAVVYGGDAAQRRSDAAVIPWSAIADRDWTRAG